MTSLDPPPPPKRLRFGPDRQAILDTPGSQYYNAALDIAMDSQLPETIEDVSQTPAPMQARVHWDVMSAETPHINMIPADSLWSQIPPAQPSVPTQVDSTFPVTLPDTQVDLTQTQPVSEYSDHYHEFTESKDDFFLPSIPEGVPVHHMTDPGHPVSVHSSPSEDFALTHYTLSSGSRIRRPTPVKPVKLRKKRGPYDTRKKRALEQSQKMVASQKSSKCGQKSIIRRRSASSRYRPTQLDTPQTQRVTQIDTQIDESQAFASAPTPNVLGNDGRYGEMVDEDPVSQFSSQNTPRVPSQRLPMNAIETFCELQRKSRARVPARLVGERNVQPPRRQTSLPGQLRRRRISQNRFVSDENARLFQRRPVRPIRLDAPLPQFRQLPLHAVINNLHDEVNLTLEEWRQMGLSEFNRHDVIVKIPGGPLTRYRLVSSFREDFERNPRFSVSSSNGSATDIRGSH